MTTPEKIGRQLHSIMKRWGMCKHLYHNEYSVPDYGGDGIPIGVQARQYLGCKLILQIPKGVPEPCLFEECQFKDKFIELGTMMLK